MATPSPTGFLGWEQFRFLREALIVSAALEAADELGVLRRLAAGPTEPTTLARDCAIGERGAQLLLAALAGLGVAEAAADGGYRLAVSEIDRLVAMHRPWRGLAAAVRDDRPVFAGDTPAGAEAGYPGVVGYLGGIFAPLAEEVAKRLAPPGRRVLDVGVGAAPWSIAFAARDPECHVTAVDLPAVLPVTRHAVAAAGMEGQFDYLGGDLFGVDLGCGIYDIAIAGNICHLFDEATNRRLLARLYGALRPGGVLAILDALPNERFDGPRPVVLYALGLLLRTNKGRIYPFSTYAGWLRDAGYEGVERFDLSDAVPTSLVTARRPA